MGNINKSTVNCLFALIFPKSQPLLVIIATKSLLIVRKIQHSVIFLKNNLLFQNIAFSKHYFVTIYIIFSANNPWLRYVYIFGFFFFRDKLFLLLPLLLPGALCALPATFTVTSYNLALKVPSDLNANVEGDVIIILTCVAPTVSTNLLSWILATHFGF